jgi:hypothetical protein
MHDDTERWRRLTILDILCLFPSFALGAATVRYLMDHPSPDPFNSRPWPMDESLFGLTFVAMVLGSVYAAPVSLAIQFIFRRRRARLSLAEWLWLEPLLFYALTSIVSNCVHPIPLLILYAAAVQFTFSFSATAILVAGFSGSMPNVKYQWTDVLGCFSCAFCAVAIVYVTIVNPIMI